MDKINILLVDDQISSLIAMEDILSDIEARVIKAGSAKEALMIMLKNTIDCVLLDVSMPEMDGFEFLKTLRNAPAHSKIPVIMVTGKIFSENETLKAYKFGAVDFLLKPVDPETVYRKVSFIVQQAKRIKSVEHMNKHLCNLDIDIIQPLDQLRNKLQAEDDQQAAADLLVKLNTLSVAWKEVA